MGNPPGRIDRMADALATEAVPRHAVTAASTPAIAKMRLTLLPPSGDSEGLIAWTHLLGRHTRAELD
jgi:hypothetical protein